MPSLNLRYEPATPVTRSYVASVKPYIVASAEKGGQSTRKSAMLSVTSVPLVNSVSSSPLRLA